MYSEEHTVSHLQQESMTSVVQPSAGRLRNPPPSLDPPLASEAVLKRLVVHYAAVLSKAATRREMPPPHELETCRSLAMKAADHAVPLQTIFVQCGVETYRLWERLPELERQLDIRALASRKADAAPHRDVMKAASEVALSSILSGHAAAAQNATEQGLRQGDRFLDALLSYRAAFPDLLEHGERLGLQLGACHAVVALSPDKPLRTAWPDLPSLEHSLRTRFTTGGVLAGRYADTLVALVAVASAERATSAKALRDAVTEAVKARPSRQTSWRIGIGRPRHGVHGIRASYEEACEALEIARRTDVECLGPDDSELLLRRVLGRDRAAMEELVRAVLLPLTSAHHGPGPLLDTLEAYFAAGCMTTQAARALHLSVRAVTYRLVRVKDLTNHDVNVPEQRFALETALRGARILEWPRRPLPDM
jgi:sugar diacid utilization regulator